MKKLALLFLLSITVSCQFFGKSVPSEKELLEKRLKDINWKTLDQLPTIALCDSIKDKNLQKECFFRFFTDEIKSKLQPETLSEFYPKNKILNIKVTIIPDENLVFESDSSNDLSTFNKPKLDSILAVKLIDFPAVVPAMKQGVLVKSTFIIPFMVTK